MIRTFKDEETRNVFERRRSESFPAALQRTAYRKLVMIHSAENLLDLRSPPGNHLEKLRGSRAGQHSIRINDRWRVCFEWRENGAYQVEIVDYHS